MIDKHEARPRAAARCQGHLLPGALYGPYFCQSKRPILQLHRVHPRRAHTALPALAKSRHVMVLPMYESCSPDVLHTAAVIDADARPPSNAGSTIPQTKGFWRSSTSRRARGGYPGSTPPLASRWTSATTSLPRALAGAGPQRGADLFNPSPPPRAERVPVAARAARPGCRRQHLLRRCDQRGGIEELARTTSTDRAISSTRKASSSRRRDAYKPEIIVRTSTWQAC